MTRLATILLLAVVGAAGAGEPATPDWITRSNTEAQVLLKTYARFYPEMAGKLGVAGVDSRVIDLGPAVNERVQAAFTATARDLAARHAREKDTNVRQDLEILRQDALLMVASREADQRYLLPVIDVAKQLYEGVSALLADQVASEVIKDLNLASLITIFSTLGLKEIALSKSSPFNCPSLTNFFL
jgi:hypothetical protein